MKFLFKYRDFAKSAWSLAGGMLVVTAMTAWRTNGDLGMTGLTLGLPIGVLLFWLFYTIKLQTMARRPSLHLEHPADPQATPVETEKLTPPPAMPRPYNNETTMARSVLTTYDLRNRSLLGRDPVALNEVKKHKSVDQWHR